MEKNRRREKKWNTININYEHGFLHPESREIIGEKSINVYIGEYRVIIFEAGVSVYWGFDENGKLIEVYVSKGYDSF